MDHQSKAERPDLDQVRDLATRASTVVVFGTAEGRDHELGQLGRSLSRLAASLDRKTESPGWSFAVKTLGNVSSGLATQIERRTAVTRVLKSVRGLQLLRLLLQHRRIQAQNLRDRIHEPVQSNLVKTLKPLIDARHLSVLDGKNNSKYYMLTPQGRLAVKRVLEDTPTRAVTDVSVQRHADSVVRGTRIIRTIPLGDSGRRPQQALR